MSRCPESLYAQSKERNPGTQGKERKAGADGGPGGMGLAKGGVAEICDVFAMAEDAFNRGPMCHNCLGCILVFASKPKRI